jgi:hypothetical protein
MKLYFCPFFLLYIQTVTGFHRPLFGSSHYRRIESARMQTSIERSFLESQREELVEALTRIDNLQYEIQRTSPGDDVSTIIDTTEGLGKDVDKLLMKLIPPVGVSMESYEAAMRLFLQLPASARLAFTKSLDLEDEAAGDYRRIPEIVTKLYEEKLALTPKKLTESMKAAQSEKVDIMSEELLKQPKDAMEALTKFYERSRDETELESKVNGLLGRLAKRDEQSLPTKEDLKILTDAIDSSTFVSNCQPMKIPGGYAIPGQNRKQSAEELLKSLDSRVPNDWDCSVCYIPDITASGDEIINERGNMLILFKNDFLLSNAWLYNISTVCALTTTLFFAFGIFGSNDAILSQLSDATSLGDYSGVDLLNTKVAEFVLPLFAILMSHELGHFLVSKKEKIETASPTLLPFPNSLPLLGTLTRITSSPRNLTALFDFSISGPVLGFISSFGFLLAGLLATKAALDGDSGAAELLPALPVGVLKLSTLGGSIVDTLYGGDGFITSQDSNTPVSLHPFFIAGFCGMLINAAEMLPLGATDGGRLSLSLFGRQGHAIVGGLTWFALLVASFTLEDRQGEVLVTAWVINNFVQNDMEIPCRDETDSVDPARVVLSFGLWFLAVLALVPMA